MVYVYVPLFPNRAPLTTSTLHSLADSSRRRTRAVPPVALSASCALPLSGTPLPLRFAAADAILGVRVVATLAVPHACMLHVMRCSYPGDGGKLQRMSLIEEGDEKKVRAHRLQQERTSRSAARLWRRCMMHRERSVVEEGSSAGSVPQLHCVGADGKSLCGRDACDQWRRCAAQRAHQEDLLP